MSVWGGNLAVDYIRGPDCAFSVKIFGILNSRLN